MSSIQFHPSDDVLARYTAGDLDSASSIMINVHLELCVHCRHKVAQVEQAQAQQLASVADTEMSDDLTAMLGKIIGHGKGASSSASMSKASTKRIRSDVGDKEELAVNSLSESEVRPEIGICAEDDAYPDTKWDGAFNQDIAIPIEGGDKTFHLPKIFRGNGQHIGPWSRLPGKIKRASVSTGDESKMNFIYMARDSALPQHTHQGEEITLVIAGHFYDENTRYGPGDFIVQGSSHKHTPKTMPDEDCLCLTLLDAPLIFTSGMATLLNPFSQMFFR